MAVIRYEPMKFTRWQKIVLREQFGVPKELIYQWGRGYSRPGPKYARKVMQACGLRAEQVMGAFARRAKNVA